MHDLQGLRRGTAVSENTREGGGHVLGPVAFELGAAPTR